MIKVKAAHEPPGFDAKVRKPGHTYLGSVPAGKKVRFRGREYWRKVLDELHDSYQGICAYTCHYIPADTGGDTVEHFEPKSLVPSLAYEWSNYRFVCSRLNARKGNRTDVVDPFLVPKGMFRMHFPSLQVQVGEGLSAAHVKLAKSTIKRLKLNQERNIKARLEYVTRYRDGKHSLSHLEDHAPFIHGELKRQRLTRARLTILMPPALYPLRKKLS